MFLQSFPKEFTGRVEMAYSQNRTEECNTKRLQKKKKKKRLQTKIQAFQTKISST